MSNSKKEMRCLSIGYSNFRNACIGYPQTLKELQKFLKERNESILKKKRYEEIKKREDLKEKIIEFTIGTMLVSAYFCLMILNPKAALISIPMSIPVVFVVLRSMFR
jgi:hypothetical protein